MTRLIQILLLPLALLLAGAASCRSVPVLAEARMTDYVIVTSANAPPAEQTAAKELAEYLRKSTGASFQIVTETTSEPSQAIYLGWTEFAASKGLDGSKLSAEEWRIKTIGDHLVITGGRPRGTLYGVYDFLEKNLGIYWLDRDTELVPSHASLNLAPVDRQGQPVFRIRNNYPTRDDEQEIRFRLRNRQNYHGANIEDLPSAIFDAHGGREFIGGPNHCHNLHMYVPVAKYAADHPEYYALDNKGKRSIPSPNIKDHSSGSICFTHPEVRKIVLAQLLDWIAADRKEFPPGRPAAARQSPPIVYDVSQQDNIVVCHCPSCRALVKREGSESGPLIDFINELADGVGGIYPDVKIQTFAYQWSQSPPLTLRLRPNVVIRWCDWWAPFGQQTEAEPWHPLTAPANAWRAENLRRWSSITPAGLHVWDYGEFCSWPGFPFTLSAPLSEDLNFMADNHVFAFFLQNDTGSPWSRSGGRCNFSPLYNWLSCQLMLDPRRPVEPLIQVFMDGYYGPAAPYMRSLYDKLASAQKSLPSRMATGSSIAQIGYVTASFHAEIDRLLQQAESVCATDIKALRHVQLERIRCDSALLDNWDQLKWKLAPGESMPFEREAVIARIEERASPVMTSLGLPPNSTWSLKHRLNFWRHPPSAELPPQFRDLDTHRVMQFLYPSFNLPGVNDPEAASGKAVRIHPADESLHHPAPAFGLYNQSSKKFGPSVTIPKAQIPQDGKYHLYKVGLCRMLPGTRLWGHSSWTFACHDIEYAHKAEANDWEVWVSAKFTGPAYIRDSQDKQSHFYVDRVLLVNPEPVKAIKIEKDKLKNP
ncbi:MAG: hypothetical protein RL095_422 [Verrucomicrobiota bacterium]|jgi:hypothetical protein